LDAVAVGTPSMRALDAGAIGNFLADMGAGAAAVAFSDLTPNLAPSGAAFAFAGLAAAASPMTELARAAVDAVFGVFLAGFAPSAALGTAELLLPVARSDTLLACPSANAGSARPVAFVPALVEDAPARGTRVDGTSTVRTDFWRDETTTLDFMRPLQGCARRKWRRARLGKQDVE
jgi:hypothetical protein